jgi:hypothetical protein
MRALVLLNIHLLPWKVLHTLPVWELKLHIPLFWINNCTCSSQERSLTGPVGKPQEEGMMSTTVSFPSFMIPRFNRPVGERNHFWRLLLADFGNAGESLARGVSASSNVEPAHNTTKQLCPNLRWGCQSHQFAVNKGLDVWCGNRCLLAVKSIILAESKQYLQ